ncbi:AEC family transporter [Halosimplex salinum]|uniref:AEC family transporter n=1 Tax=Halosimplex salinum TaxID=1710538 RepID=UPI000F467E05|nr:AEC family transporter [Halosimplex salinum]
MSLVSIFASAILPVVGMAALGYVLGWAKDVEVDALNTTVVYVLAPALVFHSVATTDLSGAILLDIALGVTLFTLAMTVVAELVGRAVGVREPLLSALVLVTVFSNSGNYGIPLSEFAFGETGRSTAVIFLTTQSVLIYTVGVYIAARSGSEDWTEGVERVFTVPLVYAVAAALAGREFDLLPAAESTAMETVGLLGDSSIPVMLIILGIELARTDYGATLRTVGTATVLKMVVAPVVGIGLALAIGFDNPTVGRVYILETATPSAVTPLILLIEFGDSTPVEGVTVSEFASTVVLVTMLVSIPAMTLLISLLQSGVL